VQGAGPEGEGRGKLWREVAAYQGFKTLFSVACQPCGFVQYDKAGIFVEYIKRGTFALQARPGFRKPGRPFIFPAGEADALARPDTGFRPRFFAVYLYPALAEQALNGREGNLRQGPAENPVKTAA
jgi:hypothetical protein